MLPADKASREINRGTETENGLMAWLKNEGRTTMALERVWPKDVYDPFSWTGAAAALRTDGRTAATAEGSPRARRAFGAPQASSHASLRCTVRVQRDGREGPLRKRGKSVNKTKVTIRAI